jgi:hypothetical protein
VLTAGSVAAFGRTSRLIIASGAKVEVNGIQIFVDALRINGVDKAAGIYSAATDSAYFIGNGSIVVGIPPTATAPASFELTEDVFGNLTYSGTPFADVDSASLTVTLSVNDGTITGNAVQGITVGGSATARTFTGTTANLNAYFTTAGSITYQGALNNSASRTLTTTVSDGVTSANTTSTINFVAMNDLPTLAPVGTLSRVATGGEVSTNGNFTIHKLTASGTFTPSFSGEVEVLLVGAVAGHLRWAVAAAVVAWSTLPRPQCSPGAPILSSWVLAVPRTPRAAPPPLSEPSLPAVARVEGTTPATGPRAAAAAVPLQTTVS